MKRSLKSVLFSMVIAVMMASTAAFAAPVDGATKFNDGWRFILNDDPHYSMVNYEIERNWEYVTLPHDWSIALGTVDDKTKTDGATAYYPGGIGWYNKSFEKMIDKDQKCYIIFDGVYNNSEYWINGKNLGRHPYGYSPLYYDLTDYLRPVGQKNELMVRVDHSHFVDSRWYTGSGIYRDVELLVVNKLHIPIWGTYITTPEVSKQSATVKMEVEVKNDYCSQKSGELITDIVDMSGKVVATTKSSFELKAGEQTTLDQSATIANPALWGIDTPNLYYAQSRIVMDGKELETRTTRFGVRTIKFDAATGFYLNGENMKIKGVCLHHDGGLVGTAVPKAVWKRRLLKLKEGGCNAIRASHNPTSADFLELCDELGLLVQQEFFDEWDNPKDKRHNMNEREIDLPSRGYDRFFQEWAERDLKVVMLRDRNCPSIFQWSIGNEIEWTYPGNKESTGFFGADAAGGYFWNQPPYSPERIKQEWEKQPEQTYDVGRTARKLAAWVREMDLTRPVTSNCILPSISYETGYIDALDVAGFSYRRVMYDYGHKHYPDKPLMGTENLGQWHEWKAVLERPFVSGIFIWTGVNYLGEMGSQHGKFPEKVKSCGLLDCAGFDQPSFNMMKSLWTDAPMISIYSQYKNKSHYKWDEAQKKFVDANPRKPWDQRLWDWEPMNMHWNYAKGDEVVMELYSNCEEIELLQNGKSLGKKKLSDFEDHIYKWAVTYSDGSITAKGFKGGKVVVTESLYTAGNASTIRLTADRSQIAADNVDAAHVVAQLLDAKGREIKGSEKTIKFVVNGDCKTLGVDNGSSSNTSPYLGTEVETFHGRCLLIVQSGKNAGKIIVTAQGEGLKSARLVIDMK